MKNGITHNPEPIRNQSGVIIIGGQVVAHTLQCAHCLKHWTVITGSRKTRGWCNECRKVLCGNYVCMKYHAPKEAILDFIDGGGSDKENKVRVELLRRYEGIDKLAKRVF